MSGSNDALTQMMLMQMRQQNRRPSAQAQLAQQMMQQSAQGGPVWGTGPTIARAIPGILGAFLASRAETSDREREDQQMQQMQDRTDKTNYLNRQELAAFMGGGAPAPMPQEAPQMTAQGGGSMPPPASGDGGVEASTARYNAMPGRPPVGASYREPEWAAGLPPANGRINALPLEGGATPAQAPQGQPDAMAMYQRAVSSSNPMIQRMAPGFLAQANREDARNNRTNPTVEINGPQGPGTYERMPNGELRFIGARMPPQESPGSTRGPIPSGYRIGANGNLEQIPGAPGPRAGLSPTIGQGPNGEPVMLLPREDGTVATPQMPPGVSVMPRTREINTGTELLTVDQGGTIVARRPIDIRGREIQEAEGKAAGADNVAAPQAFRTATDTLSQIDGVLNHGALRAATGLMSFTGAMRGTPMYDFGQRVQQLQGRAFLQAFESLRGGGAITEIEGRKATDALARLNPSASAADFRQALTELRDVVDAGRARAEQRLPRQPVAPPGTTANPAPAPGRLRFNPATGDFE